jgi:DNA (cytosine-5)-methyltransferase 1
VCSGIEAASVAWHPLGWSAAWLSEIEAFPSAVLAHHYPETTLYGDFTKIKDPERINLLVGGTPCQDFSVAGLRAGLDGARGNLTLEFLRLVDQLQPKWIVWENVPGVLSIDRGRTFGKFLGALGQLGYGLAYRVLDAQYFGVPQRRRRVFVVGYLGDWRRAAAVLFERHCLSGYPPPSREAGKGATHDLAPSLTSSGRGVERGGDSRGQDPVVAMCLNAKGGMGRIDAESETFIARALRGEGFDASEDGTGRGTPLVAIHENQRGEISINDTVGALNKGGGKPGQGYPAVFGISNQPTPKYAEDLMPTLNAHNRGGGAQEAVAQMAAVRRLTPKECCRLQGFPDDYLDIQYRGKPAADGPKYKALGNSMAVPVMSWIGERIDLIEKVFG